MSLDLIDLSSAGSAFHTAGRAKENARSANLVRVRGLMLVILSEECRLERVTLEIRRRSRFRIDLGPLRGSSFPVDL